MVPAHAGAIFLFGLAVSARASGTGLYLSGRSRLDGAASSHTVLGGGVSALRVTIPRARFDPGLRMDIATDATNVGTPFWG